MSKELLIYSGNGADPFCIQALETQLNKVINKKEYKIRQITHFETMLYQLNPSEIHSLIIPGGNASTIWVYGLGKHPQNIKCFLNKHKISYLGVCAGGIIGCNKYTEQKTFQPTNITFFPNSHSFLQLSSCEALAPVLSKKTRQVTMDEVIVTKISNAQRKTVEVINILGPGFICHPTFNNTFYNPTEILGTYQSLKPLSRENLYDNQSIDHTQIAESVYNSTTSTLLLGSHWEFDSEIIESVSFRNDLKCSHKEQTNLAERLKPHDILRRAILTENLNKIGILTIPQITIN